MVCPRYSVRSIIKSTIDIGFCAKAVDPKASNNTAQIFIIFCFSIATPFIARGARLLGLNTRTIQSFLPNRKLIFQNCIKLFGRPARAFHRLALELFAHFGHLKYCVEFFIQKINNRSWQGNRPAYRPASNRYTDHLCRVGDDTNPWRNAGRSQIDAEFPGDSA